MVTGLQEAENCQEVVLFFCFRDSSALNYNDPIAGFVQRTIPPFQLMRTPMTLRKSPSGAYFPYGYKGGELFGVHSGSYGADEDGLIALFKAEEDFFLAQNRCIGYWVDFYEDKLTDRVIAAFIEFVQHVRPRLTKLAIVGCSFWDKRKVSKRLQQAAGLDGLPVRFYSDPEDAKTWLVNERG
jgi:hypothetical protein